MDQNSRIPPFQGTDEAALAELGARVERARLRRNLTQQALATEAGISRSTVRRLESGESTQLTNLVRVLRVLGLLPNLETLVPEPVASPLDELERQGKPRRRASGARGGQPTRPWVWGDDA